MTESSNTCDFHGAGDIRNCVGYAIQSIDAGLMSEGITKGTKLPIPKITPNVPPQATTAAVRDIAKMLVHRRARRQGIGTALMEFIEQRARESGFTLLTLDTKRGEGAEVLYERGGWTRVGVIPNYALDPDGTPCDTVIFYKDLRRQ